MPNAKMSLSSNQRVRRRPSGVCAGCGAPLSGRTRIYCDGCLPSAIAERDAKFSAAGQAALRKLRAESQDPMSRADARAKLREANLRRLQEQRIWDRCNPRPDPATFAGEILLGLRDVSLYQMKQATGLSVTYCAQIKRGQVPHPRHWEALRGLGTSRS